MKRRDFLRTSGLAAVGVSAFPFGWVSAAEKKPKVEILIFKNLCKTF